MAQNEPNPVKNAKFGLIFSLVSVFGSIFGLLFGFNSVFGLNITGLLMIGAEFGALFTIIFLLKLIGAHYE